MARKTFDEHLSEAESNRIKLDDAISRSDTTNIIYYRSKMIKSLKSALKLRPDGVFPAAMNGTGADVDIDEFVYQQTRQHSDFCNQVIKDNKKNSTEAVKDIDLIKDEFGNKFKRLHHDAYLLKNAINGAETARGVKGVVKSSVGIVGTAAKATLIAVEKVITPVGKYTILLTGAVGWIGGWAIQSAYNIFSSGDKIDICTPINTTSKKLGTLFENFFKKLHKTTRKL